MGFSRQEYWSGLPFPSPVDHILSELSTMPHRLGWPHTPWLSFIELGEAVVHVITFASCPWLWFQCLPSVGAYRLTWISLTLDVGYLFTAARGKHSRCSLPWMWGSSSRPQLCAVAAATLSTERGQIIPSSVFFCCCCCCCCSTQDLRRLDDAHPC